MKVKNSIIESLMKTNLISQRLIEGVNLIIININCRADGLAPNAPGGEANEDGIVGGPRTPQQIAAQKRLQQTQAQVDEVKL